MQGEDEKGIDYDKLIKKFGSQKLTAELLDRFTKITGMFMPEVIGIFSSSVVFYV